FEAHRAIADGARITLAGDDFRSRAAGNQGVKARDGSARNRYETKWKQLSRHNQTGPVDELAHSRHLKMRQHKKHASGEREDSAQFHESAQINARREQ